MDAMTAPPKRPPRYSDDGPKHTRKRQLIARILRNIRRDGFHGSAVVGELFRRVNGRPHD